ncbi:MAG: hypothetical protein JWN70_6549 [Planctomycetaceae bacterium]|nr:hypothetical protein [Planctomycetaceae bacterium]
MVIDGILADRDCPAVKDFVAELAKSSGRLADKFPKSWRLRLRDTVNTMPSAPFLWKFKHTLLTVGLIAVLGIASIAMTGAAYSIIWFARSDPPTWKYAIVHRASARRSYAKNDLRQIAVALWGYLESHKALPPAGTFRSDGSQGHSWMTQILPYDDQAGLFQQIHQGEPWNSPHNAPLTRQEIRGYRHPVDQQTIDLEGPALADFAANQYVMGANWSCARKDFTDGMSNTFVVGEVKDLRRQWADPRNFRDPALGINRSPRGFGGHFPGGALFALADGSVRFVNEKIEPQVLRKLGTPNGGEIITKADEANW